MKRVFLILAVIIIIAFLGLILFVKLGLPNVGEAPDLNIERTPERIERGKYLAHHVMLCVDCHSIRDFTKYSAPLTGPQFIGGAEEFTEEFGLPGNFYPPNLTPFHLGEWTDGEIFRSITAGVSKDGHALFPAMPYPLYSQATKEDIYSVIAYLRTLKPIENEVPPSEAKFPVSFLLNTMPKKAELPEQVDNNNKLEYGRYLTTVGGCIECHTPFEKGKLIMEEAYTGGREFPFPSGTVRTSNITPHPTNGIGSWNETFFVNRFKMYADSVYSPQNVGDGFNTPMPWTMYAGMEVDDLKAIYAYLQSLEPVDKAVVKYTPN